MVRMQTPPPATKLAMMLNDRSDARASPRSPAKAASGTDRPEALNCHRPSTGQKYLLDDWHVRMVRMNI